MLGVYGQHRAHPRSRGENRLTDGLDRIADGSSPLTRGKPGHKALASTRRRLIPAHAGKTRHQSPTAESPGAHPRSRGENSGGGEGKHGHAGSSPLTRGKHSSLLATPTANRLIPAHAGKTKALEVSLRRCGAHPRSRGENELLSLGHDPVAGSSPLTRGKRRYVRLPPDALRLIPAHAGKTKISCSITWTRRAHPRSRGENLSTTVIPGVANGSSPLTRGKPFLLVAGLGGGGLIPAHAGKTSSSRTGSVRCGAHPRSRGENLEGLEPGAQGRGSSPLTRGKPRTDACARRGGGLIPAHAGKTPWGVYMSVRFGAHPRSRGENAKTRRDRQNASGSSPLTRGKRLPGLQMIERPRLIPAHAGKTVGLRAGGDAHPAHPRSRGENNRGNRSPARPLGSSPLTRGKHAFAGVDRWSARLIPAHAGKTPAGTHSARASKAHPRSRGENSAYAPGVARLAGSSPLTRGKHTLQISLTTFVGLIPAHAGKT